mmetsp:Transcript_11964/g.25277  ORF Transcript_11964/g.25277 Transcript_11964/m.25277 type:complete len:94 (-) Transcript_11964:699-980(-)
MRQSIAQLRNPSLRAITHSETRVICLSFASGRPVGGKQGNERARKQPNKTHKQTNQTAFFRFCLGYSWFRTSKAPGMHPDKRNGIMYLVFGFL